jgi:hypothetical protein
MGSYYEDTDGNTYFTADDSMSGWWSNGYEYGIWECQYIVGDDDVVYKTCEGNGLESEYHTNWESLDYFDSDGSEYWEYTEEGSNPDMLSYGFYENSLHEWFYGETTEEGTYYEDYTGYWYEDIIEEVTHGEDEEHHYWKNTK